MSPDDDDDDDDDGVRSLLSSLKASGTLAFVRIVEATKLLLVVMLSFVVWVFV